MSNAISLTPGFSPVTVGKTIQNCFNGFPRAGKPLKRLACRNATSTIAVQQKLWPHLKAGWMIPLAPWSMTAVPRYYSTGRGFGLRQPSAAFPPEGGR